MLPFLDKNRAAGVIMERIGKRSLEAKSEQESGNGMNPDMKEAAEDVMRAMQEKSVIDLAYALHAFFMICESLPHEENEAAE